MKRTSRVVKAIPVTLLTDREIQKQRAKAVRAEQAKKSKEISLALLFSKHDRLSRAMLSLQKATRK